MVQNWKKFARNSSLVLGGLWCVAAYTPVFAGAAKGKVFFVEPKDGATVTSPVKFRFGTENFQIKPLTDRTAGGGHLHLLINSDPLKPGTVIPFNESTRHYGKGQTEAEVKLAPGKYEVTLQPGDYDHHALDLSETIHITVK